MEWFWAHVEPWEQALLVVTSHSFLIVTFEEYNLCDFLLVNTIASFHELWMFHFLLVFKFFPIIMKTLFLVVFVLVWLELTQWLPWNNFGGFFVAISLICWVHWSWSSTSCILVKGRVSVITLKLGSQLRQGLAKVRAKSESQESHSMLSKV